MQTNAIGIFDSGVGGTSIWKEINTLLPYENTIYLADSRNAPYGPKGKEAITELSIKNTEYLLTQNCKLIVVACNTATTNAIDFLRANYNIPFIGIEPAIKPAALQTQTNTIGILATRGTLSSALFSKTSTLFASNIKVIEQHGDGIVELIESGKLFSDEMTKLLKQYLQPMIDANIDYLVLGCTHYPYLMPLLIKLLPQHVKIIDSGAAVARQTKSVLEQHNLLNTSLVKGENTFFTNSNTEVMQSLIGTDYTVEYLNF
ncbi:glutamate racemase [Tamlana nanhaiensis]|uniref:Glutamate racemase n=1 Tax=Neotamlana nanhaiensis TaxID=1382798 RepID=A0A0D7W012_9FLAO|nr:glutamate racemase [Tamlana nanhaiensis]KJD32475.1 glutamate racemase [Tamlana nanhaiensis]